MKKNKLITIALIPILALFIGLFLVGIQNSNADYGKDYQTNGTILVKYNGTDSFVSVPEGITEIASDAFSNNPLIENIVLPETVTQIGNSAFSNCMNLKEVILPDSLETIGESAFSECINLNKINFGDKLYLIGSGIFANCSSLKTVDISDANGFFTVNNGVLYSKDLKTLYSFLPGNTRESYIMPNDVENLSRYAFFGAKNLKNVTTSTNLKNINDYAFFNLANLENITINKPVNSINMGAFQNCPNLKQVIMPESVINIYPSSFGNNNTDLTFICDSNSYAYKFALNNNIKVSSSPVIDSNKYSTIEEAYVAIEDEESLNINDNLQIADDYIRSVGGTTIVSDRAFVILDELKVNSGTSNSGIADEHSDKISDYLFYQVDMNTFSFGEDNIEEIGKLSFARSTLESISIPETVKTIGYGAFYHCDNLRNIIIPETVTRVDAYAFDYTPFYNDFINSNNDFLIVGDGVLVKYNGIDEIVNIPDNVKYISTYAFIDNDIIKVINFDDNLLVINDFAFNNCLNLSEINNLSDSVILSDNAFGNCNIK